MHMTELMIVALTLALARYLAQSCWTEAYRSGPPT
jgi:hypothetical protein